MKQTIKILKAILLYIPYFLIGLYLIYPDAYTIFHGIRIETVSDMQEQAKLTPQEMNAFFPDSASMLQAPPNSVPRDSRKYPYSQVEYDLATAHFNNPLPDVDYVLARGKNRYEIFCVPCHNDDGKGMGLIVTKPKLGEDEEGMPPPADLTAENAIKLPDSRIFHILSAGQNLMFPVSFKMSEIDRWAIVRYIRYLQQKTH